MKSRLAILPIAGLLLVGAAGAVLAQSGATGPTDTTTPAVDASASPGTTDTTKRPGEGILEDVLADLVTKGTITQAQSDAITGALDAKRTELQAQREALRELWTTILEDGQITEEEIAQLPEDSPLRSLDSLLDDGVITQDELRGLGGLGRGFGPGGPGRGHGGFGPGGGMWGAPDAAPSAAPGSSS